MFTFCLTISGSAVGNKIRNAKDDCAICKAWTKKQAIRKFKILYCDFNESNIFRVKYNKYGIAVLTDY